MKDLLKTTIFTGVAVLLAGAAMFTTRDRGATSAADFVDQGQPFFPEFKDALACTDLEVVDFDSSTATASRFRVMFKDNKWVIPSHYSYPADAKDRLSQTAAAIMDLTKDTIRSDNTDQQEAMGVIDPLDAKVSTLKGRGKRIILRDASEKVLADLVIGNDIKGTERKDGGGQHYVRVPDQRRVYGVNIKAEPSTRFADWIETNLLKVEAAKIRRILFDNYKIQEDPNQPGRLVLNRGEKLVITRKDGSGPWTMDGIPPGEQLNENNLRTLSDAVADLKIVGIRPRPSGLSELDQDNPKVNPVILASLTGKGFFMTRQGLYSDQGDVLIGTDEGVVYTLRYGGPVFAEGDELVVGSPDDAEPKKDAGAAKGKDKDKDKDKAKKPGAQENRFLMVTVSFDPTLIEKPESMEPKPFVKTAPPAKLPDNVIAPDPKDPKFIADQKAAEDKKEREKSDYEKKIADGKKKVEGLAARFGPWYYVTPGESFRSINLDRVAFVEPKKPPGAEGAEGGPGGIPGALQKDFPPLRPQR